MYINDTFLTIMIDRITVDRILETANIVDVVSDFVTLKRAGVNLKGLCPFHDDKTPSFVVSPAKNLCKCFACGEGGSPVNFIMKHEQLGYYDALRYLARKYGIEVKEEELSAEDRMAANDRESMFAVNDWAKKWFENELHDTPDGRAIGLAYFRNRGFRDDILKRFQVGFCPDSRTRSLAKDAVAAGFMEKYLVNEINEKEPKLSVGTGLCTRKETGEMRDRFRGRVIWPIFTVSGRVAGFGGRVLDAATKGVNVKYLNSPESLVYSKRRELFGLFQAKEAIRKRDLCYLVEGYTDVMAMHQHGMENVVASSGTALTTDQIRLIHRMTPNITVIFDGDEAGIHASERGIDMLLAEGMNVKLLLLPDGDDPDSFGRKHNSQEYRKYMEEHQVDFIKYKTSHLSSSAHQDPKKMGELIHSIASSIAVIPDEITRVLYIRQEAQAMRLEERLISDAVNREMARLREEKQKERERAERRRLAEQGIDVSQMPPIEEGQTAAQEEPSRPAADTANPKETAIVQMILLHGEKQMCYIQDEEGNDVPLSVIEYVYYSLADDGMQFSSPLYRSVLAEGMAHIKDDDFSAQRFFINHPSPDISGLAFRLTASEVPLSKVHGETPEDERLDEILPNLLANLKLQKVQAELKSIIDQTKNPAVNADKEKMKALMKEFSDKTKQMKELAKESGERVILK